jgi:hypothetical protein
MEKNQMRSKSQIAWETAARCATLAQEADDPQEREHYARLRDAWTTLAKRCEPLGGLFFALAFTRERMSAGHLPQSSSASRFTAGAFEFFILSQSGERPER